MLKKLMVNTIIYIVILIISLPFIEILLEKFNPEQIMVHVEDPEIVYRFYPNREGIAFTPEYKVNVKTNSVFMRDCSIPMDNRTNKKTIIILGDSFSEGWGVECNETFHYPLNEKFHVLNASIHGGSMPYYVVKSRSITPDFNPDIIFIQIFDNDLDDSDKVEKFFSWKNQEVVHANPIGFLGLPAGKVSTFLRELTVTRLTKRIFSYSKGQKEPIKYYKLDKVPTTEILNHQRALEKFGKLKPILDFEKEYNGQFAFYKFKNLDETNKDALWSRRFLTFEILSKQIIREIRSYNPSIRIVFLYIPSKESLFGHTHPDTYYKNNPLLQLLHKVSGENQVELIDFSSDLLLDPERYYYPGDAHLNKLGHSVLSERLVHFLK